MPTDGTTATPGTGTGQATTSQDSGLPVVKQRLQDPAYNTILSIDGGGPRCMMSVLLLGQVERKIKEALKDNDMAQTEDGKTFASADDFDVRLGDYFNLVAGVSMGSIIAAYIATNGEGSDVLLGEYSFKEGCKDKFLEAANKADEESLGDEKFVNGVSVRDARSLATRFNAAPKDAKADIVKGITKTEMNKSFPRGSMRRLEVAFRYCMGKFESPAPPSSRTVTFVPESVDNSSTEKAVKNQDKVDAALEPDGADPASQPTDLQPPAAFSNLFLGDKTTSDVNTDLVVNVVDMKNDKYRLLCFVSKGDENGGRAYTYVREEPWLHDVVTVAKSDERKKNRLRIALGNKAGTQEPIALSLTTLTAASASVPGLYLPLEGNIPVVGDVLLSDGAVASNDPSPSAVAAMVDKCMPYNKLATEEEQENKGADVSKAWIPTDIATLSVGSGIRGITHALGMSIPVGQIPDPSRPSPLFLGPLLNVMETTSRFIPALLLSFLENDDAYKEGQYTRLQVSAEDPDEAAALIDLTAHSIEKLYKLGTNAIRKSAENPPSGSSANDLNMINLIKQFVTNFVFGEKEINESEPKTCIQETNADRSSQP